MIWVVWKTRARTRVHVHTYTYTRTWKTRTWKTRTWKTRTWKTRTWKTRTWKTRTWKTRTWFIFKEPITWIRELSTLGLNSALLTRLIDQVGATEACRELELITGNVDAEKQCKWSCCYLLDFV